MRLLYVAGVPGSGKTTLVRELVKGRRRRVFKKPFAHTVYEDGLVQLGRDREAFGGTDALSMSVQPLAVAALEVGLWPRVLAEGDRLCNVAFFRAAQQAGYTLTVALLELPGEFAEARRQARGSEQDDRWLRGRETKVARLRDELPRESLLQLDATLPVGELAACLADHPVVRPVRQTER